MMKKNRIGMELIIGIILWAIVAQIICALVSKDYLYNAIGLWGGVAIACFMAIHISCSMEEILDMDEESGTKHSRSAVILRATVALIIMGVVIYFNLGNPMTLLVGALTLKMSAYIQPHMHKLFSRFQKCEDEKQN